MSCLLTKIISAHSTGSASLPALRNEYLESLLYVYKGDEDCSTLKLLVNTAPYAETNVA